MAPSIETLPPENKTSAIATMLINLNETEGSPLNTSDWTNSSSLNDFSTTHFIGSLIKCFVCEIAIIGNVIVLLAVFNCKTRYTINCFVANLALADLLMALSMSPFATVLPELSSKQFISEHYSGWPAFNVLCYTASVLSLCVISVDRYLAVTRPLAYFTIVTHSRAIMACVFVWIVSMAASLGPWLGWKHPPYLNPYVCEETNPLGYGLISAIFYFHLPSAFIFLVYYHTYKVAVKQTRVLDTVIKLVHSLKPEYPNERPGVYHVRSVARHVLCAISGNGSYGDEICIQEVVEGLNEYLSKFKKAKKASNIFYIVVRAFMICWFPFFIILPLGTICSLIYVPDLLFHILFWFGYFKICLNPIVYIQESRKFKEYVRYCLSCGPCENFKRKPPPYQSSNNGLPVPRARRSEYHPNKLDKDKIDFDLTKILTSDSLNGDENQNTLKEMITSGEDVIPRSHGACYTMPTAV